MRYITPDDPAIQEIANQAMGEWWRWAYSDFNTLREWVVINIRYKSDTEVHGAIDYWQLPAETLQLRTGDCEDFAMLLVTLLRANGVPTDEVYFVWGIDSTGRYAHGYLLERWYTGEWRLIEPQLGVSWDLIMDVDRYLRSTFDAYVVFNDQEYWYEMPGYPFPRYKLVNFPTFGMAPIGKVFLEKHLGAGDSVSVALRPVPKFEDTSMWRSWGVKVRDPAGKIVVDKGGDVDQVSVEFTADTTGLYQMEIWNAGYSQVLELEAMPSGWSFVRGENGSYQAK